MTSRQSTTIILLVVLVALVLVTICHSFPLSDAVVNKDADGDVIMEDAFDQNSNVPGDGADSVNRAIDLNLAL